MTGRRRKPAEPDVVRRVSVPPWAPVPITAYRDSEVEYPIGVSPSLALARFFGTWSW